MIEGVFIVCIIVLIILWGYEVYATRQLEDAYKNYASMASDFIEGFNQIKETINTNAESLRRAHEIIDKHDKLITLLDSMQGFQNEVLKINPSLRAKLVEEAEVTVETYDG